MIPTSRKPKAAYADPRLHLTPQQLDRAQQPLWPFVRLTEDDNGRCWYRHHASPRFLWVVPSRGNDDHHDENNNFYMNTLKAMVRLMPDLFPTCVEEQPP